MKKVLLSVAVVAAFGLTSCGGADFCTCMEDEKADGCEELAKEWEEKVKEDPEAAMEEMQKEMEKCEDSSEEEEAE